MTITLDFWGHRGSQTDNALARSYRRRKAVPAENTIAAFSHAIRQGASGIEIDIMRTADGRASHLPPGDCLVVTHSNETGQHVFTEAGHPNNHGFISDLTKAQIKKLMVGPGRQGSIPTLNEVLNFLQVEQERLGRPLTLNIEIKDAKGTHYPDLGRSDAVPLLAAALEASPFDPKRILVSSFARSDLERLAVLRPQQRLGLLFHGKDGKAEPIYPPHPAAGSYIPFTARAIEAAKSALPQLESVHPELHDVDAATMKAAAKLGLAVNPWFLEEALLPETEGALRQAIALAEHAGVKRMNVITNFVHERQQAMERPHGLVTSVIASDGTGMGKQR